jgi:hypothetical protein
VKNLFSALNGIDIAAGIPPRVRIWVWPAVFTSFATAFVLATVWAYRDHQVAAPSELVVRGVVVELSSSSRGIVCPVIEYKDTDGHVQRVTGNECHKPAKHVIGEPVSLIYSRTGLSATRVDGLLEPWHGPAGFAALWVAIALLSLRGAYRRQQVFTK